MSQNIILFMINPMLYIVPSTAYGGAFAPSPITNVLPSNAEFTPAFEKIQQLKERVATLEVQNTISDPDAQTKPDDTTQFQSQKQTFQSVKETMNANSEGYATCDIHMIGDTLLFKFEGKANIQSMKVSEISLETDSREFQRGQTQLSGNAKFQDLSNPNHDVEISANEAETI